MVRSIPSPGRGGNPARTRPHGEGGTREPVVHTPRRARLFESSEDGGSVGADRVITALTFTTSHAEWLGLIVAAVSLIGIGGIVSTLICHRKGCFRRGRFRYGHYRLCHVHHPEVPSDGRITDEHIAAVKHAEEDPSGGRAVV